MRNLLDMIYEYELLRSKEQDLDIDLDDAERVRFMGLLRLLSGERPDARNRRFIRVRVPFRVQFTRPGGFETGEVRNLGGGGFCIATRRPPEVGTSVIVRLADPVEGIEYVFPCLVVWRSTNSPGQMGVRLDGVPHKNPMVEEDTGVWRRTLRFGAMLAKPLVA